MTRRTSGDLMAEKEVQGEERKGDEINEAKLREGKRNEPEQHENELKARTETEMMDVIGLVRKRHGNTGGN